VQKVLSCLTKDLFAHLFRLY